MKYKYILKETLHTLWQHKNLTSTIGYMQELGNGDVKKGRG
jgi:hypothetical protein